MSALRKQARQIMQKWSHGELVSEAVEASLLTEQQAMSFNKRQLAECLERDMSDPEIVEFIDSGAANSE